MKAILLQQDIVWASPEANRRHIEEIFGKLQDIDLCILPEMFSTGFATRPEGIAEESPAPSLEWMKKQASERGFAIAGSIAVHEDGKYFNRFCFVKPDGDVTCCDKHHLFTYGGEDKTFTRGEKRAIVEWKGVRILLLVCYDLRFPVWSRNRNDYDAIIYVASWPSVRRSAWDTLVRARAIENQCYVAAVNRCGNDPSCEYNGGTVFVSPYGEVLEACEDGKEEYISADFDMQVLEGFRQKFPVLNDADGFCINTKI